MCHNISRLYALWNSNTGNTVASSITSQLGPNATYMFSNCGKCWCSLLLYIVVQAYCHQFLQTYSTLACPELDCVTFLHVPCSHILFSLASENSQIQQSEVLPFKFVTLGKFPLDTLQFFEDDIHINIVILSVKELLKSHERMVKSKVVTTDGDDWFYE